ncbi:MAG: YbaB/EbfC family nucleoid-associated protein [Clostridia bacterium]|nr:YbaB/EbfC family nucleoid-associated protein [Clostridia bacterium]MEE0410431.1 YbaB/EbfC family nucleoid-associated protein [Clostridia bacterium]
MGKYKGFAGAGMNQKQNMNSMIKQAQKMQEEMERVQQETEEEQVEATSGGGAVKVVVNGKKELVSIKLDPDAVDPDDVETLEDLILAAVNEGVKKAEEIMSERMGAITGGLNIPGLF